MTRYTKLEGRRSLTFGPSNDDVDDEQTSLPRTEVQVEVHAPSSADPKALMKRAKLLRLKAKKTNSDASRDKYLLQAKDMEQKASAANGIRGKLAKRKHGAHDTGSRRRLSTYFLLQRLHD